jgi:cell pole-organizing protein PopZ
MGSEAAESIVPQAQNLQKEPSMEEILASIRRIIEDSDQAGPADAKADAPAASLVKPVTSEAPASGETEPDETGMVETERTTGRIFGEEERATPADNEASAADEEGLPTWATASDVAPEDEAAAAEDDAGWSVALETEIDPGPPPSPPREDSIPQPFAAVAAGRTSSILSEQTSRQVAAAFEELSGRVRGKPAPALRRHGRRDDAANAAGMARQQPADAGGKAGARGNRAGRARRLTRPGASLPPSATHPLGGRGCMRAANGLWRVSPGRAGGAPPQLTRSDLSALHQALTEPCWRGHSNA